MKRGLIGFLGFVLLTGVLLQIDDELLPEVQNLIDKAKLPAESEAYFYLMGMNAAADKKPEVVGRERYKAYIKAEKKYLEAGKFDQVPQSYIEDTLALPDGKLACDFEQKACAELLFAESTNLGEFLQNHLTLVERYKAFNELDDFAMLTRPSAYDPMPPFTYIAQASDLVNRESIKELKDLNSGHAVSLAMDNIVNLRRNLVQQDTLIGKMVYLKLLSENIDFAYLIARRIQEKPIIEISSLTKKEKEVEKVFAREFTISNNMFTEEIGTKLPDWVSKLIFKPNMTINALVPFYNGVIRNAGLSHLEFAAEIAGDQQQEIRKSWVRNPLGTVFSNMLSVVPSLFDPYLIRIFDLDAKITLFNAAMKISTPELLVGSLRSPYFESEHAVYLSEDGRKICFDGPLPMHRDFRCLRIKM